MLELKNAGFSYGGDRGPAVLDDVSLAAHPGEVLALVGSNGSGKSSILGLLSGQYRPRTGSATLDGRELHKWTMKSLARRRAVLPQHSPMQFGYCVEDIVAMGRAPWASEGNPARDAEVVEAALQVAGVDALRLRSYTTLSGGERQRVHLARVLAQVWPSSKGLNSYLLLDEPTSALDIAHSLGLYACLRQLAAHGVGVVLVVHELSAAMRFADRVAILRSGRVVAVGEPGITLNSEQIAAAFSIHSHVECHPAFGHLFVPLRPLDAQPPIRGIE
jgi:iron complex transport system ATP-binding protein